MRKEEPLDMPIEEFKDLDDFDQDPKPYASKFNGAIKRTSIYSPEELRKRQEREVNDLKVQHYLVLFNEVKRDNRWETIINNLISLVLSPNTSPAHAIRGSVEIIKRMIPEAGDVPKANAEAMRDSMGSTFFPYSRQVAETLNQAIKKYEEENKINKAKDAEFTVKDPKPEAPVAPVVEEKADSGREYSW